MNTTVTRYDTAFYVQALDRFVATGECAETDTEPLYAYLLSVMNDSMVKVQVLGDEVCARIFYDTMIQFIQLNLEKERYNLRKSQSERTGMKLVLEWSMAKRKDGWQALLQQISDKYREYGFDSRFYRSHFGTEGGYADDEVWEKMVDDWEDAFQLKMHEEKEKEIAFRKDALERRLRSNLKDIPEYIRQNRVDKDEFFQTWGMMSGLWNTVDFERIRKIVRIQRSCPEIVKVARKMGRMADDEGREQIRVAEGNVYKMEYSSKCDILGISTGNDLNALLPIELAHSADSELEDLFVYKYLTRKLQTFRYKSEIMQPARRIETKPARPKGPMIVCLDTSGSMAGKPEKIAHSLLIKLLEIADRQRRNCFLIAFSVSIHPIDVRKERARLLEFSQRQLAGIQMPPACWKVFRLLKEGKEYMNADVLWVSDFKDSSFFNVFMEEIRRCREAGTHFYGLQIGITDNEWHHSSTISIEGIYSFATVLKVDIYASHHRGFRHGEACIDFIALRQQVFALDKDVGKTAQTVVGTQVPEYEAFLLLLTRGDRGMETLHVLYTGRQAPASLCKVRTGIEFVFGSRQYRILHVQPAIIGIHLPVSVDAVAKVGFHAPVLYLSGVDVLAQGRVCHDDVVPVDVVEVHPIGHGPSQKLPRKGEFIVH